MINIPTWKKALTILVCLLGFLYSIPNLLAPETRAQLQDTLGDAFPHKTVNLGLDLRGGAHLLYSVDVDVVFKERADGFLQDLRTDLRKEKIGYSRVSTIPRGVRVVLRSGDDAARARKVLRGISLNLNIVTNGNIVEAVMNEAAVKDVYDQTLSQSTEIVRRRIDELGTTEPVIQRQGEDRLLIQAPGADAQSLKNIIGTTAKLNFHLVKSPGKGGASLSLPFLDNPAEKITLARRALITGDQLVSAQPSFDQNGQAVISFRLNNAGGRRFCSVTREHVNKPFAIVLDNEVLSAPVIREPICGGQGQISGGFTVEEANDLALLLRAGALPAPMHVIEERTVGPSLGADSVAAGRMASMIGLVAVLAFMLIAYGRFGLFANMALLVNVALIFSSLSVLQATLTLPGIAGIVLTIGMAVDANVLIFDRIREELAAGRSVISAIDAGYSRAMATIIDSNLTTLIAAFILFSFGTGPIKGFSVTLGIGIVTSFFTAIMVTRLIIITWLRWANPKDAPV